MRRFLLTFDTEDFISGNSVPVLHWVLERLKKYDLEALFFITGHMAEKLRHFPAVVDMLGEHQIGYHSSSHSVHPTLFEFTDVEEYEQAYRNSLERETAHVNPLNGEIEGKGGILALRELFHNKQIVCFRAPGHCWTPPHLQALRTLGIVLDFSTDLSATPVNFRDVTFYPYPLLGFWHGKSYEYRLLLTSLIKKTVSVLTIHPSLLVNRDNWDSIYSASNPKELFPPTPLSREETRQLFHSFDLLLANIAMLQRMQVVDASARLEASRRALKMKKLDVERTYELSMRWALDQNYRPKFLLNHFLKFFEVNKQPRNFDSDFKKRSQINLEKPPPAKS